MIQPSRILNEKNGFLGLTYIDCAILVMFTLQLHGFLSTYEKEWIALGVGPLLALGLVQVRIKYRRGIIASTIYYFLRKRTIRVPGFTRNETPLLRLRDRLRRLLPFFVEGEERGEENAS